MNKKIRQFGSLVVMGIAMLGLAVGITPAATVSAATLNQQWIRQPHPYPATNPPDSIAIIQGSTLDAGLINVQVLTDFAGADVERFQLLNGVTLANVDTQLALATSGDPAKAKPAMQWFKTNTRFYSGASTPEHMRYKIIQQPGTYYIAQITPGRVAATAKQFTVRGTTSSATLPSTTQTLKMEANNTFSVSTGGTIPTIRKVPLRVQNVSSELHLAQFLPVGASTTPQQAANWCNGTGPSPVTGAAPYGIGTMSGGVSTVVETFTIPTGRYILADFLPNSQTGTSNLPTMCKLVKVTE
jgi:hypothetical protein